MSSQAWPFSLLNDKQMSKCLGGWALEPKDWNIGDRQHRVCEFHLQRWWFASPCFCGCLLRTFMHRKPCLTKKNCFIPGSSRCLKFLPTLVGFFGEFRHKIYTQFRKIQVYTYVYIQYFFLLRSHQGSTCCVTHFLTAKVQRSQV